MLVEVWIPIVNCGLCAGDTPMCFPTPSCGFETEEICQKWIDNQYEEGNFTENEVGGCVCPISTHIENPKILNEDGDEIAYYDDEPETEIKNKVFVVESKINLSCDDTETIFDVVGVADNKDRAKEMLKQEVEYFFGEFNERFVSNDPEDDWGAERELSVDNKEDFPNDEYYRMVNTDLSVFCEINIVEKVINA